MLASRRLRLWWKMRRGDRFARTIIAWRGRKQVCGCEVSKTARKRGIFLSVAIVLLAVVGGAGYCRWTGQIPAPLLTMLVRRIQLPPGFKIELYATGVPNARSLTLGTGGTVFVGSRRAGNVYALTDSARHDQ